MGAEVEGGAVVGLISPEDASEEAEAVVNGVEDFIKGYIHGLGADVGAEDEAYLVFPVAWVVDVADFLRMGSTRNLKYETGGED